MYIYSITNIINGKMYIGSSKDYLYRKSNHLSELKHNKHINPYLQRSYNKYGKENFEFKIIATAINITRDELYEIEADYRDRLDTYIPNGYNINKSISGPPDRTGKQTHLKGKIPWNKGLTKETDERINSISQKKKGVSTWSKGLTKETDNRIKKHSKEQNEKQRNSLKGTIPWNKGIKTGPYGPMSEEHKNKIGKANKISLLGKKRPPRSKEWGKNITKSKTISCLNKLLEIENRTIVS